MRRRLLQSRRRKSQSAMEYLMTYGWAILIIAIVLAALFQLGVFDSANFAPKAPPGACQVFRPNGPGTTSFINTEGVCNGELPQYVASFSGSANIIGSFSSGFPYNSPTPITLTAWIKDPTNSGIAAIAVGSNNYGCSTHLYEAGLNSYASNTITYHGCCNDYTSQSFNFSRSNGGWHFIAISYSPGTIIFMVDGVYQTYGWNALPNLGGNLILMGQDECDHWYFTGFESNVQLYNTSLSPTELQALYQEGIGGAPIDLQNLVGWWPLNGNSNDYSGNGNNGVPNGVTYTSGWTSGYAAP